MRFFLPIRFGVLVLKCMQIIKSQFTPKSFFLLTIFLQQNLKMSRTWATLPIEIIQLIIENLKYKDQVRQCALVCKGWQLPAQQSYFENVIVNDDTLLKFLKCLKGSTNQVGEFVKVFDYHNHLRGEQQQRYVLEAHFKQLVKFCPNVKTFRINEMPDTLWPEFIEQVQKGNWSHLQQIPPPGDISNIENYTKAALACPKLMAVTLILWNSLSDENEAFIKKLSQGLGAFKRLKFLTIHTLGIIEDLLELESRVPIDDCPTLEHFSLYASYALLSSNAFVEEGTQPSLEKRLTAIRPHGNLKRFEGSLLLSDKSIKYVVRKFPNLEHLTLNTEEDYHDVTGLPPLNISLDVMDLFFGFISNLQSFKLGLTYPLNSTHVATIYFKAASKPPSRLKIHYQYCGPGSSGQDSSSIIHMQNAEENTVDQQLNFQHNDSDYLKISFLIRGRLRFLSTASLNFVDINREIGKSLEDLHLYGNDRVLAPAYNEIMTRNVYNAAEHCLKLKKLTLSRTVISKTNEAHINESVETLILDHCPIANDTLQCASTSFPCLKYITITADEDIYNSIEERSFQVFLDLTNSNIDTLIWKDNDFIDFKSIVLGDYSKMYLKVTLTEVGEEKNYVLCAKLEENATSATVGIVKRVDSLSSLDKEAPPYCIMHILCKSIKSFKREFIPFYSSTHSPQTFELN